MKRNDKCPWCGTYGWHTIQDCDYLWITQAIAKEIELRRVEMKEDETSSAADSQNLTEDKMDPTKVEAITSPGQKKVKV